ncbi:MAG: hypothetical protein ABI652_05780, partial [Acidobacteriota bacterium]
MTRPLALVAAATLFVLLATANSGGYRYGISDQAFYIPAVAQTLDPSLFPRDRALLEPQRHFWLGGHVLAAGARALGGDLPVLFLIVYVLSGVALFAAAALLARALGATWWTVAAFLLFLTLRHQITKTGVNSLEGYMHPRMVAFAVGAGSLAAFARGRRAMSIALVAISAVIHTSTAFWFGVVVAAACLWESKWRRPAIVVSSAAGVAGLIVLFAGVRGVLPLPLVVMDAPWLAAIADRTYLFPANWPAYAWAINLAYPVVIVAIHRRRRTLGVAITHESALVAGLVTLVPIFLLSVPVTVWHVALAVQMQVNRVFWLLDFATLFFIAWWLTAAVGGQRRRVRVAVVATLAVIAAGR